MDASVKPSATAMAAPPRPIILATKSDDAAGSASDDFALRSVPHHALSSGIVIGALLLASNISLPVLIIGGRLGVARGFWGTLHASLWGGLVLAAVAGGCGYAGARSRLSTYVLIVRAFGVRGGQWLSLGLAGCVIGWFGIVLRLFVDTTVRLAGGPALVWALLGMMLMGGTTVVGIRAMSRLSNVMLPAKLALLIWAIWAALHSHGPVPAAALRQDGLDDGGAIALVVGGWIVGAVIAPDFTRYSRSAIGGAWASAAALGIGYPVVLVAAAVPAIMTGNGDLLQTVTILGLGFVALTILLLSSWTNGALNLYSGSLMLSVALRSQRRARLIWAAAALGTLLGVAGIAERLVPYLTMLSLSLPPIAGVYLPRFVLDERRGAPLPLRTWRPNAIAALIAGIATAAWLASSGRTVTGIGSVDSLVTSMATYLVLEAAGAVLRSRIKAVSRKRD